MSNHRHSHSRHVLRRSALLLAAATALACTDNNAGDTSGDELLGPELTAPRPGPGSWSFTGAPASPLPFDEPGWDVQVHSRDRDTWRDPQPMDAHHGADCGPPPNTHRITRYDQMVFRCRDHVMTAIAADGYGAIVLTPDRQLDWSAGDAIVRFDVSTFRSSKRDWIKVWVSPYDAQLPVPAGAFVPDLNGPPAQAVFVEMTADGNLCARVVRDFDITGLPCTDWPALDQRLEPSASRRTAVEVRISRTHVRVWLPEHNIVFTDTPLDVPLSFTRGVVQFAHYSYTPGKCDACDGPNTWHWDEVRLAPSVPFTIVRADKRYVDGAGGTVTLRRPAPANAHFRFVAAGVAPQLSFDGGATWRDAVAQRTSRESDPIRQYWTPVPAGTQSVTLRPGLPISWWPHNDVWIARDFSVWAQ